MTASFRPALRRRVIGIAAAALVGLAAGVATSASATAAGQTTCPTSTFTEDAGGWVKHDELDGRSFTYPEKVGFTVVQVCYKASTSVAYLTPSGTVTSTVTNGNGAVQDISHVSVRYAPVEVPTEPAPVVTVESFSVEPSCEIPSVLAGTVTTTVDWTFDRTSWSWIPAEPVVVDERTELSLTPAQLAEFWRAWTFLEGRIDRLRTDRTAGTDQED